MVECLQQVDNQKLLEVSNRPELVHGQPHTERWYPVIDGDFLDENLYQVYKQGRTRGVDFMHGFGQYDAAFLMLHVYDSADLDVDKESLHQFWLERLR